MKDDQIYGCVILKPLIKVKHIGMLEDISILIRIDKIRYLIYIDLLRIFDNFNMVIWHVYKNNKSKQINGEVRDKIAIECKATISPKLMPGNHNVIKEVNPTKTFVVAPLLDSYVMRVNIEVVNLSDLIEKIGRIVT